MYRTVGDAPGKLCATVKSAATPRAMIALYSSHVRMGIVLSKPDSERCG